MHKTGLTEAMRPSSWHTQTVVIPITQAAITVMGQKMNKYRDLLAYPIALLFVYGLLGLVNWSTDPGAWNMPSRVIWIVWAVAWGEALRIRLRRDNP